MTKPEWLHCVALALSAQGLPLPQAHLEAAVTQAFAQLTEALARGETCRWPGFGTFEAVPRAARTGTNPQTGEPLKIPAKIQVRFQPSASLKVAVQPKAVKSVRGKKRRQAA